MIQQYNSKYGASCLQKLLYQKNGLFSNSVSLTKLEEIIKKNLPILTSEQKESLSDIHYSLNKHGLMAIFSQYEIGIYFKGMNNFQDFFIIKYYHEDKFTYQNPLPEVTNIIEGHEVELFNHIYIPFKVLPLWLQDKIKKDKKDEELSPSLVKKIKMPFNLFPKN